MSQVVDVVVAAPVLVGTRFRSGKVQGSVWSLFGTWEWP